MENTDAMPPFLMWSIIGFFAVIVVIAILVARAFDRMHRPVAEEQSRAERLAGAGLRVEGTVVSWARHPGGDDTAPNLRLLVQFLLDEVPHQAELVAGIDRGLLSGFSPGSGVFLLVDPKDPGRVAIDRSRSFVKIPRR
ncbi:hypothetical protein [Glutamicibacter sp. NPDC087344]|uniref:hypothetical protein n=1 Tax=Glutamicibacter sp. NPDC087344 TaxID=3363994 RepID=UPI0037FD4F0A